MKRDLDLKLKILPPSYYNFLPLQLIEVNITEEQIYCDLYQCNLSSIFVKQMECQRYKKISKEKDKNRNPLLKEFKTKSNCNLKIL